MKSLAILDQEKVISELEHRLAELTLLEDQYVGCLTSEQYQDIHFEMHLLNEKIQEETEELHYLYLSEIHILENER